MKLSIIIPAFNSEHVIERCLDSVFNQDLPKDEFEVIVVDDGSTDDTFQLVSSYFQKKGNAKLIKQKNQRQGAARNNALKIAKGEYIWFIDSDDYIKSNVLRYLYSIAKSQNLDILGFHRKQILSKHSAPVSPPLFQNKTVYNQIYKGQDLINFKSIYLGPCFCFYRKSYLSGNNIQFKERLAYEDNEFMLRAYYYASKVFYITDEIYYHDYTEASTTRTSKPQPIFDLIKITRYMIDFTDSLEIKDKTKSNCYYYSTMTFNTALARLVPQDTIIKHQFINKIRPYRIRLIKSMIKSRYPKYILEGMVLFISTKLLLQTSKVIR